ncbi:hypothetical protein F0562_010742 [Nyssa sinensis]|uniref:Uncharacterized protein n=1 Tax=Nyssa sinensis TaxID=561372 RepID=A0A5J5A1Z3_9ASTE|nr:hypothetical protein F0562_010742 [Nyssa sinensis]
MSGESLVRNEETGNTDSDVCLVAVPVSGIGVFSHDPSRFDPPLPRIKDDRDLVAFIANCKGFIKFHPLVIALGLKFPVASFYRIAPSQLTPSGYQILMGFQALAYFYNLRLGFSEFWASHIVKQIGNDCYYVSPRSVVLIQRLPQGEKGWDKCTLKIGGVWRFPFDWEWSIFLDPSSKQVVEGPTIDILEPGLFGIPIGIPFGSRRYSLRYSLDREGFSQAPLKMQIFGADGPMKEVMVMVRLEEAPHSSTVSIVDRFSCFVSHLTGVIGKREA